jgi:transcriptional regulator of heat shock response
MNERQSRLLKAIIDQFIGTAEPVGSHHIIEAGTFNVSCATVRNEMRFLGEEGYLQQPHVSAGRVPTAKGYRVYVNQHLEPSLHEKDVRKKFDTLRGQYFQRKDQERVFDAVAMLAHMTPNVAFATVPHKHRVYYLGLANVLRQPEFQTNPSFASGVVEVLEDHLADVVDSLKIDEKIRYYIGQEHILPQIQSCSIVITDYKIRDERGVLGVLGPMRMDYGYNTVALDMVADLLRSGG